MEKKEMKKKKLDPVEKFERAVRRDKLMTKLLMFIGEYILPIALSVPVAYVTAKYISPFLDSLFH